MKICHIISMQTMDQMGSITRAIYENCAGNHFWFPLWNTESDVPEADVYILHCFKNEKFLDAFINFKKPEGSKVISIIHSMEPCQAAHCSDLVVTLSKAWHRRLEDKGIKNTLIRGAINLTEFLEIDPDYERKIFGKISRPEPGKFLEEWHLLVDNLLNFYDDLYYTQITNDYKKMPYSKHEKAYYIENVEINNDYIKSRSLGNMCIYASAHRLNDPFVETFNVALLEAMASGLCPIVLVQDQPATEEMLEGLPIARSMVEFEALLHHAITHEVFRRRIGILARLRAQEYSLEGMVEEWDQTLLKLVS